MRGKVLFVCSGNSCRSPMAQAIFQKFVDRRITVVSAGTETNFSGSISREAVEVLREDGIDIENFVSSVIKKEIIEFSDLIFVMEEKHRKMVLELFPNASDRTFVLNIPDPAGGNIYEYRRIRDIIKEKIHDCVLTRIKI
ncbi:MAG: hypothetical protein N2115_01620 [bacterium]|nr:hypothetical protein [bacterium]